MAASLSSSPAPPFSYIGIETFAMAAFEVRNMREVRLWSQLTHWTVIIIYFLCTLGIILTVQWNHGGLLLPFDPRAAPDPCCCHRRQPGGKVFRKLDPCNATFRPAVASAVTGILVFTTLSAANASLYVASRTLYGLTYQGGSGGAVRRWLQRNTSVV
ncbi:hypothetical protein GGTG_06425 [Gaeumannomyces tritici R3-111a-1]|uniref:Amino acid permease/ SLC12A domain-containing protein n=1 Tax=Gaeumannomyces tritici (strain R3-111a-1) TaxID=644352 RepID=J3NYS3_GAET3|nr:hypothetical protein GGTG_06425 [Gaeumannomyces tritici R3-111a-1]EJT76506.1 hypothetical protein GGTG_06425 [Gaeumannomyces tritici R3-111a-1]